MLSRHADNLFWLARYVERAENTARLLEAAARLSAMPVEHADGRNEWEMAVIATGTLDSFKASFGEANARSVVDHLAYSEENPSSIRSCLEVARANARSVRTALTMDMWETINSSWLEMRRNSGARKSRQQLSDYLSWVKETSLRFDGSAYRTMLRNDAYYFLRLGTNIERADFTARILNVKADVLDPDRPSAGGSFDYFQWSWILRSVSALTSYHWVYRDNLKPHLVADLLILREEMPRSLVSCYANITRFLDDLARDYGRQGPSQRSARSTLGRLQSTNLDGLFRAGLADFLADFVWDNGRLGSAIAEQYLD
jgi:uncharacterized alpha-E superfamily protein